MAKEDKLRLDYKRTILVGFAFAGIMCVNEVYDYIMPLILQRMYGMVEWQYGIIMGLDNLLAIFLLPLFGSLSDKAVKAKSGRRTTFITWGTIAACISIVALCFVEFAQYKEVLAAGVTNGQTLVDLGFLDAKYLSDPYAALVETVKNGTKLSGTDLVTYNEYLTAYNLAQQSLAKMITKEHPMILMTFIAVLLCLLTSLATYRSPAIALMPDVTPKPLRSQANALITFMGGAGGLLAMGIYGILAKQRYQSHIALWLVLAGVLLILLLTFRLTVKENKLVSLRMQEEEKYGVIDEEEIEGNEKLSKPKMKSLILILTTIFLWFMGYNCVKSHLSVYATTYLLMKDSSVTFINMFNGVGGAIALLPVAIMASKFGRKKSVLIGLIIAAIAFVPCFFFTSTTPQVSVLFAACFIISGFGMVCVNVNTLPMVTELSKGSNVGKYTGMYYVFSMSAQAITPFLAGLVMDGVGKKYLFIYGIIFILLGMVTMFFAKHGDSKAPKKNNKLEYFSDDN